MNLIACLLILLITLILFGVSVIGMAFNHADNQAVINTRRRQTTEHDLAVERKAHAKTTRSLERQRAICDSCPHRARGGAA